MNRVFGLASVGLLLGVAAPGWAQSKAADKPDAIVCQLVDCDDAAPAAVTSSTPDARPVRRGETRGFSLARPKSAPAQAPAAAATTTAPASRPTATASATTRNRPKPAATGQYDLNVAFMLGSDKVNPRSMPRVSAFAAALKDPRLASRRVRIEGHTDSSGTADKNQDLSERRAKAIADMLQADGVDLTRLDVQGYGSSKPLPGVSASNGANRRVVAVLVN